MKRRIKIPIFDFECEKCDVIEEKMIKFSDDNPRCLLCDGDTKKLIGTPMVKVYDSDLAAKQQDLRNYTF